MYEKAFRALRLPRLYTPQGTEKDYRNVIGPMTRALFVKCIETVIVKCSTRTSYYSYYDYKMCDSKSIPYGDTSTNERNKIM